MLILIDDGCMLQYDLFEKVTQICELVGGLSHYFLFDILLRYGVEDVDEKQYFIFE